MQDQDRKWRGRSDFLKPFFCYVYLASSMIPAFADPVRRPSISEDGFAIIEKKVELLRLERKKFEAEHPFKGRLANAVVKELNDQGYVCKFGYIDMPTIAANSVTIYPVRTAMVFCNLQSQLQSDMCAQRNANLEINWQEPNADEANLEEQLETSLVKDLSFRCVEKSL